MFGDLPAILALERTDERAQISVRLLRRFGTDKVVRDALVERGQAGRPAVDLRRVQVFDHDAAGTQPAAHAAVPDRGAHWRETDRDAGS